MQFPAIFALALTEEDANRAAYSEALRLAFEELCKDKVSTMQLKDIQDSIGQSESNRGIVFRALFEDYLRFGGQLSDLHALVGVLHQYPSLMEV